MHIFSILKISTAAFTVLCGIVCSIIEIRKNPNYWLNRFFGLFFISASLGFFFYFLYHIILSNAKVVIPLMITSQILFQLAMSFLLLTEFTLEHSEKIVLSKKYIGIAVGFFLVTSLGYAIWQPTLNREAYNEGHVDTHTPTGWFIFVFSYRIAVMAYVLWNFIRISRTATGLFKKQTKRFSYGMGIIIVGTLITLLGGIEGLLGIILEIFGLILFNIGILLILDGFLITDDL